MPKTTGRLTVVLVVVLLVACSRTPSTAPADFEAPDRPNILLIVVDDMGFSDLGSFGGEIETPHLDRLALDGIRFSRFVSAPMCSPARAMMLTGVDAHKAGFGNMAEELAPNQQGQPGYEGFLASRVATLPTLLSDAGYRTYVAGKWHLGSRPGSGPHERGFERSFVLDSGGASHFPDMRPAYAPSPDARANYWEDGRKLDRLPDGFDYSSQFYVDRLIDYLSDDSNRHEPFFAYLAFTAPHWPLQAPDAALDAQRGRYDAGYDVIRHARLSRQKRLGLVPPKAEPAPRSPKERPWDALDDLQRKTETRAMEVYAAMIAEIDRHTGRLVEFLEDTGELDDTLILFLSDNGPEGHDLDETWPADAFPEIRRTIDASHDFSYAGMGRAGSYVLYGPNWANAGSPAFRLHKGFPTEGGTRVAAFVRYPALIDTPAIVDDLVYVADVTPTILDIAGVVHPGTTFQGRAVEPMTGMSFAGLLAGKAAGDGSRVLGMELMGKRAIRHGRWKLVHMPAPWGNDDWQLFDLSRDTAEQHDLAANEPDLVATLKEKWVTYAMQNAVIIPDWVSGY